MNKLETKALQEAVDNIRKAQEAIARIIARAREELKVQFPEDANLEKRAAVLNGEADKAYIDALNLTSSAATWIDSVIKQD